MGKKKVYTTNAKSILLVSFSYMWVSPNLILSIYFSIYTFYIRVLYSVNILITYVLTIRFKYFFDIRIIYNLLYTFYHFCTIMFVVVSVYKVYISYMEEVYNKYIKRINYAYIHPHTIHILTVTGSKPTRDMTYH